MIASGGGAAKVAERKPTQVDLLTGSLAELEATATRVRQLVGLCRMGVIGYHTGDPEGKSDEEVPSCHGIIAITKHRLDEVIKDLAVTENELLHLQEQLGELAQ